MTPCARIFVAGLMMKHLLLMFPLALLLAGCNETAPNAPQPIVRGPLAIERIGGGYNGGLMEPARLLIRDPRQFADVWAKAWSGMPPMPPLPSVDFTSSVVIVVAMGGQATGGYAIEVKRITAEGDRLIVNVESVMPGAGCAVTLMLTQPFDIVRVPVRASSAEFFERAVVRVCR